jgi:hypothetical protein
MLGNGIDIQSEVWLPLCQNSTNDLYGYISIYVKL